MPRNKDLKHLVRSRMTKTGERYTTARLAIAGQGDSAPGRADELDAIVQLLATTPTRTQAIRDLVGGVTATELRRLEAIPEDVFQALQRGLRDTNAKIRWWSLQILDHVADPRALHAVAELLDDPVDRVRRNAVHALGCVACKRTADMELPTPVLERMAAMASGDPSPKVRREATHALACHRDHSPKEPL